MPLLDSAPHPADKQFRAETRGKPPCLGTRGVYRGMDLRGTSIPRAGGSPAVSLRTIPEEDL